MSSVATEVFDRPGKQLDASMREQFQSEGYLAFAHMIEPHEVEALRDALREVMARLLADARRPGELPSA